jgi:hypothetical protein
MRKRRYKTPSPYDSETLRKLRLIGESERVCITAWEARFMATVFSQETMSAKQRAQALWIVAKYEPLMQGAKPCSSN